MIVACILVAFLCLTAAAETAVDLTGRVLTAGGRGANGLIVSLEEMDVSDTTGPYGYFHLYLEVTAVGRRDNRTTKVTDNSNRRLQGPLRMVNGRFVERWHHNSDRLPVGIYVTGEQRQQVAETGGAHSTGLAKQYSDPETLTVVYKDPYRDTVLKSILVDTLIDSLPDIQLDGAQPITHRLLAADVFGNRVGIIGTDGELEWSITADRPIDVWGMPNGNVLFNDLKGVKEVNPQGEIVWEYTAHYAECFTVQPLPGGFMLIGGGGPAELITVSPAKEIFSIIPLQAASENPHNQIRDVRITPQGTYLVCFYYDDLIQEVDGNGTVLHEINIYHPFIAIPLRNGNKLIGTGTERVVELDSNDNVVWEITGTDLPEGFIQKPEWWLCAQRLDNGNTMISTHRGIPQAFEVTPEKEVVWSYTGNGDLGSMLGIHALEEELDLSDPCK